MNINVQNKEVSTNLKSPLWGDLEGLNPAKDEVMIEFGNALKTNALLEIYGYTGNLLQTSILKHGYSYISVSVKDLKPGIYFYKITSNNEVVCKNKLLIIK